ncbi:MAG: hypothetical protein ACO398_06400 [Kiritimatiellia bacterium]
MKKLSLRLFASLVLIAILSAGCASLRPDYESEMPWNTPQTWEGSPMIPGLNN